MFTITNVCSNSNQSFHKEFKCVICGCQLTVLVPPKVFSENLNLSNCFCNLYDINSTLCRLDIESIFQNSRLCSKCHEEIAQVEALNSQIEILKRQIQSIKLSYDSKLREFNVNSGAVGTVKDEAKENHEKLYNYAFHCNMPVTFIIPNSESEVPLSFSGSAPNYLQLPDQDVESLTFDFNEDPGLDSGELDTGMDLTDIKSDFISGNEEDSKTVVISSKSDENSNGLNLAALRKKHKLKNLSVRVERVQLKKKVSTVRKRIQSKSKKVPKVKQQKIKLVREDPHIRFPFACTHPGCTRRYSDELERDGHLKSVHEGISHPFECLICHRTFMTYRKLKLHANVHTGALTFKCGEPGCDKEYPTKEQVQGHRIRMHRPKDIVCEYCGKAYSRPMEYEDHLRSHTKELPFQCEICGKSYSRKTSLRDHRFTHPELNLNASQCKYCGKKFAGKYYLSVHERNHAGVYRFKCDICNFGAVAKSVITRHMLTHTDVRSLECDVCQHKFKSDYQLKKHKQLYHPPTKEFTCVQCGKSFSCKRYLDAHEETHKVVKKLRCTLCEKTFAQYTSYNYHMRHTHNVDKGQAKSN